MRIVFIAPDATRDRFRPELAAHGVQVLTESADRDNALLLLPVLKPELVLLEGAGGVGAVATWVEQAVGLAPGLPVVLMGPELAAGDLLALMRAGVREYLPDPDGPQVLEALGRLRGHHRPAPAPAALPAEPGRHPVVAVYSPKGGVGTSTLATNLAVALYQTTGTRATLVDLGLQFGDADLLLNLQPHKHLADLAPVCHDLDARTLDQILTPTPIGVRLLAAPDRLEDGELVSAEHLEKALDTLKAQKGFTVIDCASHLDAVSCRALELADTVLMPLTLDLATIRRVSRAFAALEAVGVDTAKIKLVAWAQRAEIAVAEVARTIGRPIAYQLPWDVEGVAAAINQGIPLQIGQPTAPLAQAVRQVAAELTGHGVPEKAKENGLAGLFASAFGWLKKAPKEVKLLTAGSGS